MRRSRLGMRDEHAFLDFPNRAMMRAIEIWETVMRGVSIVLAALAIGASANLAYAAGKVRLAQSSTTTNCMMTCNSQAAACQSNCVVPGTPPTGAATATGNANASTTCVLNCSGQQLACQTICAQTSPSR